MKVLLKKVIGKVKGYFEKQKEITVKKAVVYKTIDNIEEMKTELKKLHTGYDKSLAEIAGKYNKANHRYQEAYNEVLEKVKKVKDTSEIKALYKTVEPLEWQVRDLGREYDVVTDYKHSDTLEILNAIQELRQDYLLDVGSSIKSKAETVAEIKTEYLQAVGEIGREASCLIDTERLLEFHFDKLGIHYTATLSDELSAMTEGAKVKGRDLEVSPDEVRRVLSGRVR